MLLSDSRMHRSSSVCSERTVCINSKTEVKWIVHGSTKTSIYVTLWEQQAQRFPYLRLDWNKCIDICAGVKSVTWKMLGAMAYIKTAFEMRTSSHCILRRRVSH